MVAPHRFLGSRPGEIVPRYAGFGFKPPNRNPQVVGGLLSFQVAVTYGIGYRSACRRGPGFCTAPSRCARLAGRQFVAGWRRLLSGPCRAVILEVHRFHRRTNGLG